MCGIVGYVGQREAAPILLNGLEKLEYRGYDSAGVAVQNERGLEVIKARGRLSNLASMIDDGKALSGIVGIGHTRWATHGEPSDVNSHPHVSGSGNFAVVHNGIIENYLELRDYLIQKGVKFSSETDTEVIAHLVEYYYKGNILEALIRVIGKVKGSYALGVLCKDSPDEIIAVRKDSPLIVGIGKNENYIASDIPALLAHTRDIYRLEDNEFARLTRDTITVYNTDMEEVQKDLFHVDWDVASAEKGGYEHFMFKEIMEQPKTIRDTISPRIRDGKIVLDDIKLTEKEIKSYKKIFIVACGSAYHAAFVGKYVIEKLAGISVEAMLASEFRYCDPLVDQGCLVIAISQSGETADSLAAVREAKKRGARILSIVNVVGSSIASASDDVLYTWAGPEIAVATTKAYSAQLCVLYLLSLYFAEKKGKLLGEELSCYIDALTQLPEKVEALLVERGTVQYCASQCFHSKDIFFIGRNLDYAMSLEGSLKLKEISYIHSDAYAAGELKHGTISLIEKGTLVVSIATQHQLFDKMMSNVREVKTRGAVILNVTTRAHEDMESQSDYTIYIPETQDVFMPSLTVIPLQLFSYYVASLKGCDIDKPRNLAKSVTVE